MAGLIGRLGWGFWEGRSIEVDVVPTSAKLGGRLPYRRIRSWGRAYVRSLGMGRWGQREYRIRRWRTCGIEHRILNNEVELVRNIARYMLVVRCSLFVVHSSLFVVHSSLFVVRRSVDDEHTKT